MAIGTTAAIIGTAVLGGVASVASSNAQTSAARQQSAVAQTTSDAQINLYRDIYNQNRADFEPFRQLELERANLLGSFFGIGPDAAGQATPATTQGAGTVPAPTQGATTMAKGKSTGGFAGGFDSGPKFSSNQILNPDSRRGFGGDLGGGGGFSSLSNNPLLNNFQKGPPVSEVQKFASLPAPAPLAPPVAEVQKFNSLPAPVAPSLAVPPSLAVQGGQQFANISNLPQAGSSTALAPVGPLPDSGANRSARRGVGVLQSPGQFNALLDGPDIQSSVPQAVTPAVQTGVPVSEPQKFNTLPAPAPVSPAVQTGVQTAIPQPTVPQPAVQTAIPEPAIPQAAPQTGLGPTVGPGIAGADTFNQSLFNAAFTEGFNRDRNAIDANLSNQGVVFSGVRQAAIENSRAQNFQGALGAFMNTLQGFPTAGPATQASAQAGSQFAANAGNSLGALGSAQQQSAFQTGQARSGLFGNLATAGGSAIGAFNLGG